MAATFVVWRVIEPGFGRRFRAAFSGYFRRLRLLYYGFGRPANVVDVGSSLYTHIHLPQARLWLGHVNKYQQLHQGANKAYTTTQSKRTRRLLSQPEDRDS